MSQGQTYYPWLMFVGQSVESADLAAINHRLAQVETEHGVSLPLVVESGSRAWGFPSVDSDYDVRFIYVRPMCDYLNPWPLRDVIETPLDAVLDVNGWDVIKAIRLMVKGNATIVEWLASPYVYREEPDFRAELTQLASSLVHRPTLYQHYAHVTAGQWKFLSEEATVSLKRLLYVMRTIFVLRWLRTHPEKPFPPIEISTLMAECDPPRWLSDLVHEAIAQKAQSSEGLEWGSRSERLAALVTEELALVPSVSPRVDLREAQMQASEWFQRSIRRFGPSKSQITMQVRCCVPNSPWTLE